jgi:hypothetical protein
MKYILEFHFKDKPECGRCMLSDTKGLDLNGESFVGCFGLSHRSKCPEEGCRIDCPLKEEE